VALALGRLLLQDESWTAVVREQDEVEAYVAAAGMSAALGRRRAVLLLEQAAEELSVVVLSPRQGARPPRVDR
jgi:hypothetical protein